MQRVLAITERLHCKFDTGEFFFNDSNEFTALHTSLHLKDTILTYRIFLVSALCISFFSFDCCCFFFIKLFPPQILQFNVSVTYNKYKRTFLKNVVYNFLFYLISIGKSKRHSKLYMLRKVKTFSQLVSRFLLGSHWIFVCCIIIKK